ncbi:MAG: hypothetical protein Q4G65_03375 [bacterium]|nr:hypothetical protein [bacterium]
MSRLPHLGWSSNVYPLEAADLVALPDYAEAPIPDAALPQDAVILFIRPDGPDALLRGREVLAAQDPHAAVPTRIVFRPSVAKWNLLATLFRVLRNKYRFEGTGIYHVSAQAIRGLKVERAIRTLDNPQLREGKDRAASMQRLATSLRTRGYDEKKPINVQICRIGGRKDSLRQGHHRISACLACGVDRITVHFSAAGAWPRELGGCRV